MQPKIESPKKKQKSLPRKSSSESTKDEDSKPRMGKEAEFRKKMWKRIYGRKKYQLRNTGREITVSEEEIDAEIAKEKAKYSGQPLAGDLGEAANLSPGELLRNYVQFGSKVRVYLIII